MRRGICFSAVFLGLMVSNAGLLLARHSTHGTDNRSIDENAAWFLNQERSVKFCLDVAPTFGVTRLDISKKVLSAFATWESYIKERLPHTTARNTQLATQAMMVECDGSEDLKFYFGTADKEVEEVKKLYTDPIAFAQRTSYDAVNAWGKGYIWLTEPRDVVFLTPEPQRVNLQWDRPYLLDAIIRHELGHVFGIEHVPGTIMDEHLLYRAFGSNLFSQTCPQISPYLIEIDDIHELLPCNNCLNSAAGRSWEGKIHKSYFQYMMGRSPQGNVRAVLTEQRNTFNGKDARKLTIKVSDSLGSRSEVLTLGGQVTRSASAGTVITPHVFKTFIRTGDSFTSQPVISYFEPVSYMVSGMVTSPGKRINTWLQYNLKSQDSPVRLVNVFDIPFEAYSSVTRDGCVIPRHPNAFK